jgi:tetratricopeptide (TPR) repeat protein
MKTLKYIIAATALTYSVGISAQEMSKECTEFRMIASDSKMMKEFQEAATYYWKIEKNCPEDENIYTNLRYCYESLINEITDEAKKTAYRDTLIMVYDLQEKKYGKDPNWSLWHAYYKTANKSTEYQKIDDLFFYAIGQLQEKTGASFISTYYYNLMMLNNTEKDAAKKQVYNKRIIDEYISLQKLLKKVDGSERVQEYITSIFDGIAKTCEDVTPVMAKVLTMLPEEKDAKIEALKNYMSILDRKNCSNTPEYIAMSDSLLAIDPSAAAWTAKGITLVEKKKYSDAMDAFRKALSFEDADKDEINYRIAHLQFSQGQYKAAHNTASTVGGEWKSKALGVMASSVASSANSCGDTTFERKANYWYAVELAERAGNSTAAYKANCPTSQDIFNENKERGGSFFLNCWNVNVKMNPFN